MWQKCLAGMGCCVSYQFTACQLQIHPPALALPIMDSSPQALLLPCERNAEVSQWRALEGLAAARGRPTVSGTCRVGSACGYEDTWWGPQPRTKKGQSLSNLAALAWSSVTFQWPCQHRHYAPRASCYSPPSHTSLCGLLPMMWPRPPDGDATCSVPVALPLPRCLHTCTPGHQLQLTTRRAATRAPTSCVPLWRATGFPGLEECFLPAASNCPLADLGETGSHSAIQWAAPTASSVSGSSSLGEGPPPIGPSSGSLPQP